MDLSALLHKTFGFASFRANQEAVCRAATDGRDVLLVMPTGAGKSLCYQLPAIARGGTALVISPLIALMDDQAAKLTTAGLRVARIHSGLSRDESRQACRDYLDGTLQFLFIAPERMRVPGFPEMLAKRKPALIAIDEAHCISAWGHDFRPDYRTLGDYLPSLRPAPVIALTATATPTVQKDIVNQLQLDQPALFIHGFRRHNLAIEVVELSKPRRNEFTANLLKSPANRPAIVYAPSRKSAEELASKLGGSAAAYHAGLDPGTRERVQRHFLSGKLEVVVATIAFGMGIDKADVRTVVHTALPGSVEAYYQEIGRAGRDGLLSRTVLLHSFADRKMHDFFLERDYPPPTELSRVATILTGDYQMPDILRQRLKMDAETFDKAVEKLASQGAASINIEGNVRTTGSSSWRKGYDEQVNFRRGQIDRMMQFAESRQCRMSALIQHFGDTSDGLRPCGHCDFCAPEQATAQTFRQPTQQENRQFQTILRALDGTSAKATGKLHTDLALGIDRKQFDAYLDAFARAGLIALTNDTFTNSEGNVINFKRASLTHEGRDRGDSDAFDILLKDTSSSTTTSQRKGSRETTGTRLSRASIKAQREQITASYTAAQKNLETCLRDWRKAEAAKTGKPAFMVFADSVLHSIVLSCPTTIPALLQVSGIGPRITDAHGAMICSLCAGRSIPSDQGNATSTELISAISAKSKSQHRDRVRTNQSEESFRGPVEIFTRPRPASSQTIDHPLTVKQQVLDQRLHEWRKAESEKLGVPQFFVLASSTLRSIVLAQPQTLSQLKTINGLNLEKLERFGPAIIEACTS
ncbi:MAG TPA: RecQ family ATP-dependent DNA helicase [Edaphobacter sp.]|nr:RecQ family ATP-dependent DNA helicase [Edaphobacter sp.]